jgi:hypothetical protein
MKKSILLLSGLFMGFSSFAQFPVSTTPQNKKVLLEEFTGVNCTYCPDGHLRANNLKTQYGDNFWPINIHVGGYATPGAGQPDYRTPFGTAISGQTGLTGYPAGTVNRSVLAGAMTAGQTATGRTNWAGNTTTVRAQSAFVNIAVDAEIDEQTRQLRVITQYHYTANGTGTTNKLNIALLQNNIEGPQVGASQFYAANILPNGKYVHQHMLRHLLTGQWGQDITTITSGSTSTDTFFYTVPAALNGVAYDVTNLEVVAFIAEGQQNVINASGKKVAVTNVANVLDAAVLEMKTVDDVCPGSNSEQAWVKLKNNGSTPLTSVAFSYDANGGTASTYTWTGNLAYGQSQYITLPALTYSAIATNAFNISITSVNGSADNISTNNSISKTFNLAAETTKNNIAIKITLDNYGSESSWVLKNTAGSTIASSPVYTDNTAGAQADINLTLANDCYTFQMFDSFGDGLCCGFGSGSYQIWADGVLIPGMSGASFSNIDTRKFNINFAPTGIEAAAPSTFKMFPNPAATEFNLSFETTVNDATVKVVDIAGRVILSENISNVNFHTMNVSQLSNGIYMVVIIADGKTTTEKLSVLK